MKSKLCIKEYNEELGESETKLLDTKEFPIPKTYNELILNIKNKFNKNIDDFSLLAYTKDEDEIPINNQQDLTDHIDETKEFKIILEKELKEKKTSEINIDELLKYDINFNLDITDKDLENIIDSQIKEIPEIQKDIINDDIDFDSAKYKEGINNRYNDIIKDFNSTFDKKIENIYNNKRTILEENINQKFLEFGNVNLKDISEIIKEHKEVKEKSNNMNDDINEMEKAIKELHKNLVGEEEKITLRFKQEIINEEIELKKAKFISIPIKIENFGKEEYSKLFFVKDDTKSSKEINFGSGKAQKITMTGEFESGVEETHPINLTIKDPKPKETYTLILYMRENIEGNNLSKGITILLKIKGEEPEPEPDPKIKIQEDAKKLYSELIKEYNLSIIWTQEPEAINKFIEFKNDKDSIIKFIKSEFEKKDEDLYDKLKEDDFIDKDEAKKIFSQQNYDEEKIKEMIQKIIEEKKNEKAEKLYKEFLSKYEKLKEKTDIKDIIINKIKEFNFDEEKTNEYIKTFITDKDPKIKEIIDKFDEKYSITSIINEEEFEAKIIELNFNEEEINNWIEERLSE